MNGTGQTTNNVKDYQGKFSPLSITAFVLSFIGCLTFVGLILGIIDLTKKDGRKHGLSIAAVVIGAICTLISIITIPALIYSGVKTVKEGPAIEEPKQSAETPEEPVQETPEEPVQEIPTPVENASDKKAETKPVKPEEPAQTKAK